MKDKETLESYGIASNSLITLTKFFNDEIDNLEIGIEEEDLLEEEQGNQRDNRKLNLNKRIDFFSNINRAMKNYEMKTIKEDKNEDFLGDEEEGKIVIFQKKFMNFCSNNIKSQTQQMSENLAKYSRPILKEIVEYVDKKGLTCLHHCILNKMDFILNFLIKNLQKDILKIHGENSPTPLILAMMNVSVYFQCNKPAF